jgi:hypothetical protein
VASSIPNFTDGRPIELLILPKQLGYGLGGLQESFNDLLILFY